jgi:deazaflavin-dependent oxidoreductase (nitroreductase family)
MAFRRYSRYRGRTLRWDEAVLENFAISKLGYHYLHTIAPRFDRRVIPATKGRLSSVGLDKVGLVTTTGAKSGQQRSQPLILIPVGEDLLAMGSNYGGASHPAWSANLLANPECEVTFRAPARAYRAQLLTGEEREQAWDTAVDFYAGYERYREMCAPRQIRVFRLSPA